MALILEHRAKGEGGAAAAVPVALRLADPALEARLAALPGLVPIPQMARVLVTDGLPEAGDPPGVLVLADGAEAARRALRAGALAVLPRDAAPAAVLAALPAVAQGLAVLPAALAATLAGPAAEAPAPPAGPLTPREREVLSLLAAGASNKVIARRLGMSFHTAKAHVAAVLHKLGAASRADAVARGARAGLVLL
jgi:DNA-binding NarL/FixJ family response regulator